MAKRLYFIPILLLIINGCKDAYELPLRPADRSPLVVEGLLNTGQGATTVSLSRVVNLKDTAKFKPELHAQVLVERKDNTAYPLTEQGGGKYMVNLLPATPGMQYRLYIKTADGKEYRSDFVEAKQTPLIDSINWRKEDDGIRIYANTHDPSGNSKYYRWEYEETWEIHSSFDAVYKWDGTAIVPVTPGESFFRCWKYQNSTSMLLGSSVQLQSDVIFDAPLLYIPRSSEKLGVRYSILVKQYSLPKDAYDFFQLMKKNTETLGNIFDPQPSELRGNINCLSDAQETVIGYVSAASVQEKRIFITRGEAGGTFTMDCESISILNHPDTIKEWIPIYLPYDVEINPGGTIGRYLISSPACIDCTQRGALSTRPVYW